MNAVLSLESIVTATSDQLTCELEGESVILHVRDGIYYGLDPVGTFVWNRAATPMSIRAIRDDVLQRFDVDAARCEQDLLHLLTDLVDHGLVVSGSV